MINTSKLTVGQAVRMAPECEKLYVDAKARGWGDRHIMWAIMAIVREYEDKEPIPP